MVASLIKSRFVDDLNRLQADAQRVGADLAAGDPAAQVNAIKSIEKLSAEMTRLERACPTHDCPESRLVDQTLNVVWEIKQLAVSLGFKDSLPKPAGALTAFDEQVAAAIASGETHAKAADRLNTSVRTIQRSLAKEATRDLVVALRRLAANAAAALFIASAREAGEKVLAIMRTGTKQDEIKLKAALAIIEFANHRRKDSEDAEEANKILNELLADETP